MCCFCQILAEHLSGGISEDIVMQKHGVPAEYLSMPGKNHFNIIHDFLGEGGPLCKKIIEWK